MYDLLLSTVLQKSTNYSRHADGALGRKHCKTKCINYFKLIKKSTNYYYSRHAVGALRDEHVAQRQLHRGERLERVGGEGKGGRHPEQSLLEHLEVAARCLEARGHGLDAVQHAAVAGEAGGERGDVAGAAAYVEEGLARAELQALQGGGHEAGGGQGHGAAI